MSESERRSVHLSLFSFRFFNRRPTTENRRPTADDYSLSMIVAVAWPKPMHIV
jgi:hypothetical protein